MNHSENPELVCRHGILKGHCPECPNGPFKAKHEFAATEFSKSGRITVKQGDYLIRLDGEVWLEQLCKRITNDDGDDPEAYWLEMSPGEMNALKSLFKARSNDQANMEAMRSELENMFSVLMEVSGGRFNLPLSVRELVDNAITHAKCKFKI